MIDIIVTAIHQTMGDKEGSRKSEGCGSFKCKQLTPKQREERNRQRREDYARNAVLQATANAERREQHLNRADEFNARRRLQYPAIAEVNIAHRREHHVAVAEWIMLTEGSIMPQLLKRRMPVCGSTMRRQLKKEMPQEGNDMQPGRTKPPMKIRNSAMYQQSKKLTQ